MEHPEIDCTLVELGMVQGIQVNGSRVSLKLVLPFLGIPAAIRDYLIHSLQQAVAGFGTEVGGPGDRDDLRRTPAFFRA